MRTLIAELLPHAPRLGLHLAPEIPPDKLRTAIRDYARDVAPEDVLALYDATRLGSAKDGALFLADRFVFQNHALQDALSVRYEDVVRVEEKRQLLGGRRVEIDVNRGRATVAEALDFSAHADAAEYVARLLKEAMLRPPTASAICRDCDGRRRGPRRAGRTGARRTARAHRPSADAGGAGRIIAHRPCRSKG